MKYIHVKNLEHFHPGYRDRKLQWAKVYFTMIQGDPETEMLHEIDRARLISFILLELEAQQPIPLDKDYFLRKGFDLEYRSINTTIKMLHNFVELVTQLSNYRAKSKSREDKEKESVRVTDTKKNYGKEVYLTNDEHQKLVAAYGPTKTAWMIDKLDKYIPNKKGAAYKSHYAAILSWVVGAWEEANKIPGGSIRPT